MFCGVADSSTIMSQHTRLKTGGNSNALQVELSIRHLRFAKYYVFRKNVPNKSSLSLPLLP